LPGFRRVIDHPVLGPLKGNKVTIYFDGKPLEAYEGESLAAAIYAAGIDVLRITPKLGRRRSVFCMIGKCGSCFLEVNGRVVRSCITPVEGGMNVKSIEGLPTLTSLNKPRDIELKKIETDALIVGAGPAGLAAAEIIASKGFHVVIVDDQLRLGGQLIKQTHRFFGSKDLFAGLRGYQIAEHYENKLRKYHNVKILSQTTAIGVFKEGIVSVNVNKTYLIRPKVVLVAAGAFENYLVFNNNDLPGVMGAGGAQTLMNVHRVRPGNEVLIIGSGNVGLIIAYQLLQAGANVKAIIEALSHIGGWLVHAAKVRRYGVPILTGHTIMGVNGNERVESAIVVKINDKWQPIKGTEKIIQCDTVLLAVGLTPNTELLRQFGVSTRYVPELGGLVALRTKYMETTVPGVYIAGDIAGIEEATTAFIEGWIAGYSMVIRLDGPKEEYIRSREHCLRILEEYRSSPASARVRSGLSKVIIREGLGHE
jgi:sarcosine oxidase subunit alpha